MEHDQQIDEELEAMNENFKNMLLDRDLTRKEQAMEVEEAARRLFEDYFDGSEATAAYLLQAIEYAKNALGVEGEDDMIVARRLNGLSGYMLEKYNLRGDPQDLLEAITFGMQAVDMAKSCPSARADYINYCIDLATTLFVLHQISGQRGPLDEGIRLCSVAIEEIVSNPEVLEVDAKNLSVFYNAKSTGLDYRYRLDKRPEDLRQAIDAAEKAISLFPERCGYYDRAATLYLWEYERGPEEEVSVLEKALSLQRQAVARLDGERTDGLIPAEESAKIKSNLSLLLSAKYSRLGLLSDLREAERYGREAVKNTEPKYPQYARRAQGLSSALHKLFEHTGSVPDLEESISLGERIISNSTFSSVIGDHSMQYNNQAIRLHSLFHVTGQLETLQMAIKYEQEAMSKAQTVEERVQARINLSSMFESRSQALGISEDLEESIRTLDTAIKEANPEQLGRALDVRASQLLRIYHRTGNMQQLNDAIQTQLAALRNTPEGHPLQASRLVEASSFSSLQYATSRDITFLNSAFKQAQDALVNLAPDHASNPVILFSLVRLNLLLYESTGKVETLSLALSDAKLVMSNTQSGDPILSSRLHTLGTILFRQYCLSNDPEDLRASEDSFMRAISHAPSPAIDRVLAGSFGAFMLCGTSSLNTLLSILRKTVELLPRLSPREMTRVDQQYILSNIPAISSLAASVSIQANESPAKALTLLEAGRGLMARISTELRTDLEDLKIAAKTLAEEYLDLREQLRNPSKPATTGETALDQFSQRLEISKILANKEDEIRRSVPGFERFLLPELADSFPQLVKCDTHAIVAFNVTRQQAHAFIVKRDAPPRCIELSGLEHDRLVDIEQRLHGSERITHGSLGSLHERNEVLRKDLHWLWENAVKPTLLELGFLTPGVPEISEVFPRVTWVTCGLVGLMPLHAAGLSWDKGSGENTASRVISSYIPSFNALKVSQEKASKVDQSLGHSAFLVSMPTTTGEQNLSVETTVQHIGVSLQETGAVVVEQPMPSKEAVIASLGSHSMAIFACHGRSDAKDPSNGGLLLADGADGLPERLTVHDIARIALPKAQLAYLEACSTAENSSKALREEVIHLASALQMAGFPHVVATIWAADNDSANIVAIFFFEHITAQIIAGEEGKVKAGPLDFALALHHAVGRLRDGRIGPRLRRNVWKNVTHWAPFIHMG
jgi:tetratricopeptide (TPR) repeat protein